MLAITVTNPTAIFLLFVGAAILLVALVLLFRRLRVSAARPLQKALPRRAFAAGNKPGRKALRRGLEVGITTREEVRARWGEPLMQEVKGMTKDGTRERWVLEGSDGELALWFEDGVLKRIGDG